jgi:predicted DNA-binding transcriptional regulator AlpA
MSEIPKVVPASVAALLVGLSQSTLAKLRLNGNGPVYCKLGRRVIYRREDLEAWLESRIARDTSDADTRLPKSLTGQQPGRRLCRPNMRTRRRPNTGFPL